MLSLDDKLCVAGIVEICSLLGATLDGVVGVVEVIRLLVVTAAVTALIDVIVSR